MTNISVQVKCILDCLGTFWANRNTFLHCWPGRRLPSSDLGVQVEDITEIKAKCRAHIWEEGSFFNYCLFKLPFPHTNTENHFPIVDREECRPLISFAGNKFDI